MMSDNNTIYLVTGANRGIGLSIVTSLLQHPSVTVIATTRRSCSTSIPTHPTSKLITFLLDESYPAINAATIADRLRSEYGIDHLDVVIANAGASSGFKDILSTPAEDLLFDFTANSIGPVKLFHGVWPLLETGREKKFVIISSVMGAMSSLDEESLPGTAYGMSKAAVNWFGAKLAVEMKSKGLLVGILHPGWVKTSMGQAVADAINYGGEIAMDTETSAKRIIERVDELTAEKSGKFLNYDGKVLAW
ncbi:hypothetical protein B0H66DRAFT_253167 [Apodospora peruviana]|uniref:Uncharacterized protein n=1 Tax=Apodospora peruviana TaxID=516989 RepID=A0AAE0I5R3_9PEZI|nr:hypothetical protein B0H66DRAFT_253167 [Apodospora peruviana]